MGYFEIAKAGIASEMGDQLVRREFFENFHVRHSTVYRDDRDALVLVKGGRESRLLKQAVLISEMGVDRNGTPLKVLSHEMRRIFGDFGGKVAIQRSPPRWVRPESVRSATDFVQSLD